MTRLKNIQWIGQFNGYLKFIDQQALPHKLKYLVCRDAATVYQAIKTLSVRGATAIGVVTAYGVFLGIRHLKTNTFTKFYRRLDEICNKFSQARPTAVNLFRALERIKTQAWHQRTQSVESIKKTIIQEAHQILKQERDISYRLGQYGARLIKNGYGILTHCNT